MLKEYVLACMHTLTYTLFAATSQKYFSLTPNQHQPAVTSQPAVIFYHNKSAPATSHSTANRGYNIPHNPPEPIPVLSSKLFSILKSGGFLSSMQSGPVLNADTSLADHVRVPVL